MATLKCEECGALLLAVMGGGSTDEGVDYQLCGGCARRKIQRWRDEGLTFVKPVEDY